jgi:hypothetical protein
MGYLARALTVKRPICYVLYYQYRLFNSQIRYQELLTPYPR